MFQRTHTILTITILSSVLLFTSPINAQGLWDKASRFLESETGQKAANVLKAPSVSSLSSDQISKGLKEALTIASDSVTKKLSLKNAFNLDDKIRIPLPDSLSMVDSALSRIGLNSLTDELETRLNTAAELATPKAKKLFTDSIQKMSINDAKEILSGPNNAATNYLRETMGEDLAKEIYPIVEQTLAQAGAVKAYDQVLGKYNQIPFTQTVKTDLNQYVVQKAMDGIFYYIAKEEAAIRNNPTKRTTEILKQVFSSQ